MTNYDERILFQVKVFPENFQNKNQELKTLYYRLNNTLTGSVQFPNIDSICNCCIEENNPIGAYIRHTCNGLKMNSSYYNKKGASKIANIFNVIKSSDKGKVRILLYTGDRNDIYDFKISEATHNMIVEISLNDNSFFAAEPHKNIPNFYQTCSSADDALLYIEALLVDACLCHYFGVSDVAVHHTDKQKISSEKVKFLIENENKFDYLSADTQKIITYVLKKINKDTPYISFFSIFTIAIKDLDEIENKETFACSYFDDYCKLWNAFQKWYYEKKERTIFSDKDIPDPLTTIFKGIKYYGQISRDDATKEIKRVLEEHRSKNYASVLGVENRYAFIILKKMPPDSIWFKKIDASFPGHLHQAKWKIIHWSDVDKYDFIYNFIEIVPFLIEIQQFKN